MGNEIKSKKVFISYLDETDKVRSGYVDLLQEENGLICFRTNFNIIKIPPNRILKIKEKDNGRE